MHATKYVRKCYVDCPAYSFAVSSTSSNRHTQRYVYIYVCVCVCICKYVCAYVYKVECSVLATAILDICQANFLRCITKSQDRPNEFACVVEYHWLVTPTDLELNRSNSGSPAGLSPPEKNSPQKNVASAALHSDSAESMWAFQVLGGDVEGGVLL